MKVSINRWRAMHSSGTKFYEAINVTYDKRGFYLFRWGKADQYNGGGQIDLSAESTANWIDAEFDKKVKAKGKPGEYVHRVGAAPTAIIGEGNQTFSTEEEAMKALRNDPYIPSATSEKMAEMIGQYVMTSTPADPIDLDDMAPPKRNMGETYSDWGSF